MNYVWSPVALRQGMRVIINRRRFIKISGATLVTRTLEVPSALVPRKVGLIGVPFNSAGVTTGVARAPAVLRAHGLLKSLSKICDVHDYGDVTFSALIPRRDPTSGIKSLAATVSMVPAVEEVVAHVMEEGRFPLVLGGDCPVMLGGLAAARKQLGHVGLLFVD